MGYQALLFCPDEKTARTVTQVLSELEFNVETCTEPFAAVKKLMSQHFDAVVVDCDNEQNATLLFKSARNSTSNQTSLAVAVVEGQAGVAKAFRIGANLVLTKPINIEQAKGTLRVARGLLRKSEPAKAIGTASAASALEASASARVQTPAAVISTATKPNTKLVGSTPSAVPISNAATHDEDLLGIGEDDSPAASAVPSSGKFITPAPQADKFLAAAVVSDVRPSTSTTLNFGRGAASAPAPARERDDNRIAEVLPERPPEANSKKTSAQQSESPSAAGSTPSFTFGRADDPAESSGGGKKLVLAIVAAVIIVAAYAGWSHFHGRPSQPDNAPIQDTPTTIVTPSPSKPKGAQSLPTTPKPSASLNSASLASNAKSNTSNPDSDFDDAEASSAGRSTTGSDSTKGKSTDPVEAPLVVKGGKAPTAHAKAGVADAPAPSMIGIATPGAGAPPPNFVGGAEIVPKPMLQTLNISQGVSRGLLIKKVQPVYPRNALAMRVEGSIELLATISKTGDISHVKVLNGDSQLSKAATEAVRQWKYKPYLLNGEPVEIQTEITINFKLPK